jgi:tRNA dimethylallyltransferase
MAARPNLIAIVGPTASGKTALALDIAERYNGEIICADSRTIYKGMDIGTAKPTPEEQARVRHWGIDLVEPGQVFSAADFKRYTIDAISDIRSRGKLPLLVGGTGLYVDSVLYDFTFAPVKNTERRAELEAVTLAELHLYCTQNNIPLPENERNKRHVIHAIERHNDVPGSRSSLQQDTYIVGIVTPMQLLRTRIAGRAEHLFANDVEREATLLGKKYGWKSEAMTGNIYPLIKSYNDGLLTKAEVEEKFTTADYRLAKRQMTWFRRNPDIMWATLPGADDYINSLLAAE